MNTKKESLTGIDLTLDSLFNSDVDRRSQNITRQRYDEDYGTEKNMEFFKEQHKFVFINEIINETIFLRADGNSAYTHYRLPMDKERPVDFDDEYYRVFGEYTASFIEHHYGYDGLHCDCCGVEINMLNRMTNYTLCLDCDRFLHYSERNSLHRYITDGVSFNENAWVD